MQSLKSSYSSTYSCWRTGVTDQTTMSRLDLQEMPLQNADWELFVDGNSFMKDRKIYTGHAVVTEHEVLKGGALPSSWSAQAAELYALGEAL